MPPGPPVSPAGGVRHTGKSLQRWGLEEQGPDRAEHPMAGLDLTHPSPEDSQALE